MKDLREIKPTTIEGLKRLARQIQKRDGIGLGHALDRAAEQAGYPTYNMARKHLL